MPPHVKTPRSHIIAAALDIVRENGITALNARAVAAKLKCSTQPVFSNFSSMGELKNAVIEQALEIYHGYIKEDTESGKYPPYKASGMGYIRFAKEEKQLFKLLFMRDRTGENREPDRDWETIRELVIRNTGMSVQQAELFHLEMWTCVHGIAVMLATSYLPMEQELISQILTDVYLGVKSRFEHVEEL